MKWFNGINTIEELKKAFRALVKKNHPDVGGNEQDMKDINNEYEIMFAYIEKHGGQSKNHSVNDGFREAMEKVIDLEGLNIEICGSWIWLSGNTYPYKAVIREAGFRWGAKKKMWFWHSETETSNNRKTMSMDNIRSLHGSEVIKGTVRTEKKAIA